MSYADSLLATGERVIHRERQHWLVLLWGARLPIVAMVLESSCCFRLSAVGDPLKSLVFWIGAALFLGGLAFLIWATLRYLNQEYVLTNRRVIEVAGVVNKRSTDSSLEKINDAILTQSIFGRIFGFGDLEVLTASEAGIERFRMIVNPIGFKKAMMDAKHEYEQDIAGGRTGAEPADGSEPAPTAPQAPARRPGPRRRDRQSAIPAARVPAGRRRDPCSGSSPRPTGARDRQLPTRSPARWRKPGGPARSRRDLAEEYEPKKADLLGRL